MDSLIDLAFTTGNEYFVVQRFCNAYPGELAEYSYKVNRLICNKERRITLIIQDDVLPPRNVFFPEIRLMLDITETLLRSKNVSN